MWPKETEMGKSCSGSSLNVVGKNREYRGGLLVSNVRNRQILHPEENLFKQKVNIYQGIIAGESRERHTNSDWNPGKANLKKCPF